MVMLISFGLNTIAQVNINTDGTEPDASAVLDVKSTSKGILVPRMTQTEIADIVNPAVSLIVFNTDDNHFYFYDDGTDEWKVMEMKLGMTQTQADNRGLRGTDEGGKLKETVTTHWNSPNTGATNSSWFTAFPGGNCNSSGSFRNLGYYGQWWSSTETYATSAWARNLHYDNSQVERDNYDKEACFSVCCLKD